MRPFFVEKKNCIDNLFLYTCYGLEIYNHHHLYVLTGRETHLVTYYPHAY